MKRSFLVTFEIVFNPLDQDSPDIRAKNIAQCLREIEGIILLSNQWAVRSQKDAYGLREKITKISGFSDRLTVLEMSGDYSHYWTIDSLNGWPKTKTEKIDHEIWPSICNWKMCERPVVKGALFCEEHVQAPSSRAMPEWIRKLPSTIGTGLATSILFEMLKLFAENCIFSDEAAAEVNKHLTQLDDSTNQEEAILEFANFIEAASQAPSLKEFMYTALRNSATNTKTND